MNTRELIPRLFDIESEHGTSSVFVSVDGSLRPVERVDQVTMRDEAEVSVAVLVVGK